MSKVVDIVTEKIVPIIEALGYEVVEVAYGSRPDRQMHLTFFIDSVSGITLDDCEKVSNAVDGPLEELHPTDGQPYALDVSSPGLDRLFKTERDWLRNVGREVEIGLYAPVKPLDLIVNDSGRRGAVGAPYGGAAADGGGNKAGTGAGGKQKSGKGSKGVKTFEGILRGFENNSAKLEGFDGTIYEIPASQIASARQLIKFK